MAKTLIDTLVAKNLLDLTRAGEAKKTAKEKGVSIEDILYQFGLKEEDVAEAKSELTGHPVRYLRGGPVPFDVLHYIPEESARHYRMVPLGKDVGYLDVGMLAPEDVAAAEALKFISARTNLPTRVFIITPTDFQSILQEYKNLSGEVTQALGEFKKEYPEFGIPEDIKIVKDEPARIMEEAPITKMISVIMRHAVDGQASDVHIEPARDHLRVRFRVDGVLHTSLRLPIEVHPAFVTRVKVMTNLKIDETRVPQDGRVHADIGGHE